MLQSGGTAGSSAARRPVESEVWAARSSGSAMHKSPRTEVTNCVRCGVTEPGPLLASVGHATAGTGLGAFHHQPGSHCRPAQAQAIIDSGPRPAAPVAGPGGESVPKGSHDLHVELLRRAELSGLGERRTKAT